MASLPGIVIQIGADTKDAIDGIGRVNSALGDNLTGPQKFKGAVDKAFVPALAVVAGLAAGMFSAAKAGEELATANSRVGTVLEGMGYGEATDRVLDYAHALEGQIAVDEKTIKMVQAKLGTFGELTKTVNESGGAFDRATKAAFDLAASGFGTAEGNAVQLGKALNDPIKGLASLAKSGVTFTDVEKDRIKSLVESNKVGEAQALILAAIEKQVGGVAEATANGSDKMDLAFSGIKESIGVALLPAFDALTSKATEFGNWAQENSQTFLVIAGVIGGLALTIIILKAAITAITVVTAIYNAVLAANPIVLVVIAIAALIAILVLAYKNFDGFRAVVDNVWGAIQTATAAVVSFYQSYVQPVIEAVITAIKTYFTIYFAIVKTGWELLQTGTAAVVGFYQSYVQPVIEAVITAIQTYFTIYFAIVKTGWKVIQTAIRTVVNWFTDTLVPAFQDALGVLTGAFDALTGFFTGLWEGIFTYFSGLIARFVAFGGQVVAGVRLGLSNAWEGLKNWFFGLFTGLIDGVLGIFGINSPSRVFADIGSGIAEGFGKGLGDLTGVNTQLMNDTKSMISSLTDQINGESSRVAAAGESLGDALASGFNRRARLQPTIGTTGTTATTANQSRAAAGIIVTEEQIARAIQSLLLRSDRRNGLLAVTG